MKRNHLFFAVAAMLAIIFCMASCKKESVHQPGNPAKVNVSPAGTIADSMMLTPTGLMPKSQIHLVENGFHLEISNGHVLKVKTSTGELAADFGAMHAPVINQKNSPQNNGSTNFQNFNSFAPSGNGWVTYSEWGNTNGQTINSFSTNWIVPGNPSANNSQVIYIWNGLEPYKVEDNNPNNLVMQPVLQWGANGSGPNTFGGQYWTISNWCAWSGGGAYTTPVTGIPVGTNLQGVITFTGKQANGSYNYTSDFNGYSNAMNVTQGYSYNNLGGGTVSIPAIPIENWAYEVLEVYNLPYATDYPTQQSVHMTNISVQTGPVGTYTPAALTWTPVTQTSIATLGEHTKVISNNSSGSGEVDIYFHPEVPVISYPTPNVWTDGTHYSISPTNTGSPATSYSISPALPSPLTFNTTTGVISGTPTGISPATNYTVTATGTGGNGTCIVNIACVSSNVSFGISNNSGNSLSLTFTRTDIYQPNINYVSSAHSGTNPPLSVPPGTYNILFSPAGMPVNCIVTLSNGVSSPNTPGYTFTGVIVGTGSGQVYSLSAH